MAATVNDLSAEYLTEVDSHDRENEALQRLCESPFMLNELLASLGLPRGLYWVILAIQHGELVEARRGDVDLVAGRLAFKELKAFEHLKAKWQTRDPALPEHQRTYLAELELAEGCGFEWPPPLDYLVAIEAKCAYFSSERLCVMSTKSSKEKTAKIRLQVEELLRFIPCDRVALLDIIANPPATGTGINAWLGAAATADNALRHMRSALDSRLPPDSPAGQYVLSWGAVVGGTESWRGAGSPIQLRCPAIKNPYLCEADVRERRKELERNLQRILSQLPQPSIFPAILPNTRRRTI